MTSGIWSSDGTGWTLLPTEPFPDEATLHTLVEQAPEMLPLAGSPRLVILAREVQLKSGRDYFQRPQLLIAPFVDTPTFTSTITAF